MGTVSTDRTDFQYAQFARQFQNLHEAFADHLEVLAPELIPSTAAITK